MSKDEFNEEEEFYDAPEEVVREETEDDEEAGGFFSRYGLIIGIILLVILAAVSLRTCGSSATKGLEGLAEQDSAFMPDREFEEDVYVEDSETPQKEVELPPPPAPKPALQPMKITFNTAQAGGPLLSVSYEVELSQDRLLMENTDDGIVSSYSLTNYIDISSDVKQVTGVKTNPITGVPEEFLITYTVKKVLLDPMLESIQIGNAKFFNRNGTHSKPELKKTVTYYTVQPGDSLKNIAKKYGMTRSQLISLNQGRRVIGVNDALWAGDKLKVYIYE